MRKLRRESQYGHAAEGGADHGIEPLDAECAHGLVAGARDVFDRNLGELESIALAGGQVDRCRPGRAEATAERIHANNKIAAGIQGEARTDDGLPPARSRIALGRGRMGRGREPGEEQYGIVARGVELTPGLIGDARLVQHAAAVERERIGKRNGERFAHTRQISPVVGGRARTGAAIHFRVPDLSHR